MSYNFSDVKHIKPYGYINREKIVDNIITFNKRVENVSVVREMDDGDLPSSAITVEDIAVPAFDQYTNSNTWMGEMTNTVTVVSFPYIFETHPRVMFTVRYTLPDSDDEARVINYMIENAYVSPNHDFTGGWNEDN